MDGRTGTPFNSTRWSLVEDLRSPDGSRAAEAREALLALYWPAVYGYLRRHGMDREGAEEMTQGFFVDVVLRRGLLERARRESGSMRSYVLASVRNYRTDRHRASSRRDEAMVDRARIDRVERTLENGAFGSPEVVFERAWIESLLSRAMEECAAWYAARGRLAEWGVFEARALGVLRGVSSVPGYAALASRFGFASAKLARAAAQQARSKLRDTIVRLLDADGVASPEETMREILGVLARPGG